MTTFGGLSQWRDTAGIAADKAEELAARLELRARAEDEAAARDQYLSLLALAPGERVLDIGCGSGVVTREMAKRVSPGGRAVGVDSSAALLAVARRTAEGAGLAEAIEFHAGDCRRLPFADGAFDATLAATVFAHVPGVEEAIDEMIRVTKPGGRIGIFDFDGDGFVISHPDRDITRRIVAAHCDHSAVNGRLVRELPGLLVERGVLDIRARAFMPLERAAGSFYADLAARSAQTAAKVGAISESEAAAWLAALHAVVESGRFLGGRLHIFVWGRRGR